MSWWEQELFTLGDTSVTAMSLVVLGVTIVITLLIAKSLRYGSVRVMRRGGAGVEGRAYAFGRILEYLVYMAGFLVGLENLGVSLTALAAVGAILSVGIGFGLQNIAQNFISGVILLVERPVSQGDVVEVGGLLGTVEEIGMRATRIMTPDGVSVLLPNSKLVSEEVRNLHVPTPLNRFRIGVGVAYGSDVQHVQRVLLKVAAADRHVLKDPAPEVLFRNFGESALELELAVWLKHAENRLAIGSGLRFAIDAAFRENAIHIPFPQRDLHLVSGFARGAEE